MNVKMKGLERNNNRMIIACLEIILIVFAAYFNLIFIYLVFVMEVIGIIVKGKFSVNKLASIVVLSVMLPDNYTTIVFVLLLGVYCFMFNRKMIINKPLLILMCMIIFSTIISFVPMINILFFLLFISPAFILIGLLNKKEIFQLGGLVYAVKKLMMVELIATIVNFLKSLHSGVIGVYSDWSIGTFGDGQTAQFCIFAIFMTMLSFYWYKQGKCSFAIVIVWSVIIVSTNCWSMTTIAVMFAALFWLPSLDARHFRIALIVIPIMIVAVVFSEVYMPDLIWDQIYKMFTDVNFRMYRFAKLQVYQDTFFTIPGKDVKFLFFGNGAGYYNSRAALTCTGHYIHSYLDYFAKSMSDYTKEYIYPQLTNAYYHGETDFGSVLYRPYSSVIAIMGETGLCGLAAFGVIFCKICKHKSKFSVVLLGIFLGICFLENYLEYAKIVLLVFVLLLIFESSERSSFQGSYIRK
ncbi:hypothetical protein D7V86_11970 [bacterium D16-51]|nr:hypothetical protein D7V96_13315 [bacterium D16-59]RKI59584.1 hypothetical protein D7V86_11970 [bacterium D16-51]